MSKSYSDKTRGKAFVVRDAHGEIVLPLSVVGEPEMDIVGTLKAMKIKVGK